VLDIAAQAVWAVTHESARTLADVIDRRLVIGTLGPVPVDELTSVAQVIAPLLGWSDVEVAAAVDTEASRRAALVARWRR
jgi:glycerol-3-phosphate dehydrogenase